MIRVHQRNVANLASFFLWQSSTKKYIKVDQNIFFRDILSLNYNIIKFMKLYNIDC
jgi:hypothetical protein